MKKNILFETDRCYVRPFQREDFLGFSKLNGAQELMQYVTPDGKPRNIFQAKKKFDFIMEHQGRYSFSYWAVFKKSTNEFIGQAGMIYVSGMQIHLCFAFLKEFWGKGFATEAVSGAIEYGFNKLNFYKIITIVRVENKPSIHILEDKLGFKNIGQSTIFSGFKVHDYEITKEKYFGKS